MVQDGTNTVTITVTPNSPTPGGFQFVNSTSHGDDFLFAIKAADEREIRLTLQADPWSESHMLEIKSIQPWTVLLESALE